MISAEELARIRCPLCLQRAENGRCLADCGRGQAVRRRLEAGLPVSRQICIELWGEERGNREWEAWLK